MKVLRLRIIIFYLIKIEEYIINKHAHVSMCFFIISVTLFQKRKRVVFSGPRKRTTGQETSERGEFGTHAWCQTQ